MTHLRYRFSVLGRFIAADTDDINVSLAIAAGTDEVLSYSTTVTMPEWEWRQLIAGLQRVGADVRIDDADALARTA